MGVSAKPWSRCRKAKGSGAARHTATGHGATSILPVCMGRPSVPFNSAAGGKDAAAFPRRCEDGPPAACPTRIGGLVVRSSRHETAIPGLAPRATASMIAHNSKPSGQSPHSGSPLIPPTTFSSAVHVHSPPPHISTTSAPSVCSPPPSIGHGLRGWSAVPRLQRHHRREGPGPALPQALRTRASARKPSSWHSSHRVPPCPHFSAATSSGGRTHGHSPEAHG